MPISTYTSIPLDENDRSKHVVRQKTTGTWSWNPCSITGSSFCIFACLLSLVLICFSAGFKIGQKWESWAEHGIDGEKMREDGLLDPQSIIGDIPKKGVKFMFPTEFEDKTEKGDKIWDEMMPLGAGFLNVAHPREYAMPRSKSIEDDPQQGEIYSVSMTHQLHCLAVIRQVIIKYEEGDKSRFAGAGHEYHCIDYIRQAILCAGDTTLDHAEIEYTLDGKEQKYGFSGANATHVCRDWDAIKKVLIEKRLDNKTGILF